MSLTDSFKWSIRRLRMPIKGNALVLEVGSGGNPYPRANVLLDAYEDTQERHWEALVADRPTVLAFGENLPFKDKSFDFVIAAHVLEHSSDPERFLNELQRVARAGYIETPDAFMERINPYKDHRLEVTLRQDFLVIRKKPTWLYDQELVELYEHKAKRSVTQQLIPQNPFDFHVRYFWKEKINFKVINSDVDASWGSVPNVHAQANQGGAYKQKIRLAILKIIRWVFSQNRRNAKIDLLSYLRCSVCHNENLQSLESSLSCSSCGAKFKHINNITHMQPKNTGDFG